jgi:subtilisin family serine protease
MKPFALLFSALLLGACASAPAPAPAPVPVPTPVPDTVDAPSPPAPAPGVIEVVPDRWWLLDAEADGVYGSSVDRAYREVLAGRTPERTVVVAIIDSGVDIEHEDLQGNLWQNPRETPNARDDDGDGLVDDISGWNFIGGPDGSHVDDDTYEITRLFAACQALTAPAAQRRPEPVTAEECPAIGRAFEAEVAETTAMLEQISELHETVEIVVSILQQHVGQDSLTEERVRAITPLRPDLQQAQSIYLQLADAGITPALIEEELDRLERLLEYGLNPEFDPRPMVADDYADPAERVYGNLDVTGPDASHGTGVAGIVAAVRGNDLGIDGIASGVRIMAIRAVPNGDERDKDVANAIRYAVDHGAHIINMSFGKAWSPFKEVVDEAVRYADQRGVLMVHLLAAALPDGRTGAGIPHAGAAGAVRPPVLARVLRGARLRRADADRAAVPAHRAVQARDGAVRHRHHPALSPADRHGGRGRDPAAPAHHRHRQPVAAQAAQPAGGNWASRFALLSLRRCWSPCHRPCSGSGSVSTTSAGACCTSGSASAAIVFAQLHASMAGLYINTAWKQAVWIGMAGHGRARRLPARAQAGCGSGVRWRVAEVRAERGDTHTLALEPVGHDGFRFEPGQFAWIKLAGSPFTLEEHPFSFASSANARDRIEFGIKALGDFSAAIGQTCRRAPARTSTDRTAPSASTATRRRLCPHRRRRRHHAVHVDPAHHGRPRRSAAGHAVLCGQGVGRRGVPRELEELQERLDLSRLRAGGAAGGLGPVRGLHHGGTAGAQAADEISPATT